MVMALLQNISEEIDNSDHINQVFDQSEESSTILMIPIADAASKAKGCLKREEYEWAIIMMCWNIDQGMQSAAYCKPQQCPTPIFMPSTASSIAQKHQADQQKGRME